MIIMYSGFMLLLFRIIEVAVAVLAFIGLVTVIKWLVRKK